MSEAPVARANASPPRCQMLPVPDVPVVTRPRRPRSISSAIDRMGEVCTDRDGCGRPRMQRQVIEICGLHSAVAEVRNDRHVDGGVAHRVAVGRTARDERQRHGSGRADAVLCDDRNTQLLLKPARDVARHRVRETAGRRVHDETNLAARVRALRTAGRDRDERGERESAGEETACGARRVGKTHERSHCLRIRS